MVHGVVAGVPVPFPVPNPDGCKNCGLTCPLAANKEVSFAASIPVLKSYPEVSPCCSYMYFYLSIWVCHGLFCLRVDKTITSFVSDETIFEQSSLPFDHELEHTQIVNNSKLVNDSYFLGGSSDLKTNWRFERTHRKIVSSIIDYMTRIWLCIACVVDLQIYTRST